MRPVGRIRLQAALICVSGCFVVYRAVARCRSYHLPVLRPRASPQTDRYSGRSSRTPPGGPALEGLAPVGSITFASLASARAWLDYITSWTCKAIPEWIEGVMVGGTVPIYIGVNGNQWEALKGVQAG